LFEQAKTQFNRNANKRYGFFDAQAAHPQLPDFIQQWQSDNLDFAQLVNKSLHHLKDLLNTTEAPFNGTLLWAHEDILGQAHLYLFWLPMIDAIQTGKDMQPFHTHIIDTKSLPYAMRLQIDTWKGNASPKYLTLLAGRGNKTFSDAFTAFLGFAEGIDTRQQTSEFLSIVENFSEQLPEEQSKSVKTTALNYCVAQDKIGRPVLVDELSELINSSEPAAFAEFVHQQQATPNKEILTDRQSLKRYMRYFGRDHSLSISFSAERFGSDIQYNASAGTLSINKIPKSLKIQLSGYHEKNE
jgi:nucleoid-associated protein